MKKQALVGLFTILGLIGLFAVFLVIANVGTQGRYKIGVHFKSAAGLHRGALVYESGVTVGIVDQTILLPEDFTVDVILSINNSVDIPRNARFIATAPLTGDVTVEIVPPAPVPRQAGFVGPTPAPAALAILPREILPLEQQPQGSNPATIGDLLEQGQGQVHRLDRMLALLENREPKLLDTLQSTLVNANELTRSGNAQIGHLTAKLDTMLSTLQVALNQGSKNIIGLTGELNANVQRNSSKVDSLLTSLNATSVALNQTVDSVRHLAVNPQLSNNLLEATRGLAQTTTTIGAITTDLRKVTGDAATQAQLRDTVANIDAATQKVNSLLASFGATSSVYGVDKGATPAPPGGPRPARSAPGPAGGPRSDVSPAPNSPANIRNRLSAAAKNLFAIEVRVSELSSQPQRSNASPLLSGDRGPQSDFNVVALPKGNASLTVGGNDIGSRTPSYNVLLSQTMAPNLRVGAGVLYSRLGVQAKYQPGVFGVDARLYDLRHPTLDLYGNVKVRENASLFGGERDLTNAGRRSVFGLQVQF